MTLLVNSPLAVAVAAAEQVLLQFDRLTCHHVSRHHYVNMPTHM